MERGTEKTKMLISVMSPYAQKAFGRTTEEFQVILDRWGLLEWTEVQPVTERGGKVTGTSYKGNLTRREKKLFA